MAEIDRKDIPVVLLAGGNGLYIDDSGRRKPKGAVLIDGIPMVGHVIWSYLKAGFRQFIVSGGYGLSEISETLTNSMETIRSGNEVTVLRFRGVEFIVRFLNSGEKSSTCERFLHAAPFLKGASHVAMTYSDSLSCLDIAQQFDFHLEHGRKGTVVGTHFPTRFKIMGVRQGERVIRGFAAKSFLPTQFINGGFYIFCHPSVMDEMRSGSCRILEEEGLNALIASEQLMAFPYDGEWQYLDSERDLPRLTNVAREIAEDL